MCHMHHNLLVLGVKQNPLENTVHFVLFYTKYSFPLHFIMFTNQLRDNLPTDNQGPYLSQPLESAAQGGPGAEYGMLSLLLQIA